MFPAIPKSISKFYVVGNICYTYPRFFQVLDVRLMGYSTGLEGSCILLSRVNCMMELMSRYSEKFFILDMYSSMHSECSNRSALLTSSVQESSSFLNGQSVKRNTNIKIGNAAIFGTSINTELVSSGAIRTTSLFDFF